MRVYVDLAAGLDAEVWTERHARGEVPDATPYGLHRFAEHDMAVTFRRPMRGLGLDRVGRSVRHRTGGLEIIEALRDTPAAVSAHADVVLGYDERTSVPAALLARGRLRPPVVAGVGWLTTRASAPGAMRVLAGTALPSAAAVWAQCAPMLTLLRDEWGVPAHRLHFVPFGIDTDFYAVQPPPERPGVVASAGEDRFRDHDLLVRAVAGLRARRPEVGLELATGLPVSLPPGLGTVHTERLDGRMRDVYRRASVVAVALRPSVTGSGLSVILEAMASGRPVVATANPGIDDYVRDGETGVLVPPGDEAALARAIDGLLADPDRAAELGADAARAVRREHSSAVMMASLAGIVRGL